MQPLLFTASEDHFLVQGQFQLPLYRGKCPTEILHQAHPIKRVMKRLLQTKTLSEIRFSQLISRVYLKESKHEFAKVWYPEYNPRMVYVFSSEPSQVHKYVLHASHKRVGDPNQEKPEWLLNGELEEVR